MEKPITKQKNRILIWAASRDRDIRAVVRNAVERVGFEPLFPEELALLSQASIIESERISVAAADLIIVVISAGHVSPGMLMEMGIAFAEHKPVLLFLQEDVSPTRLTLDFAATMMYKKFRTLVELDHELTAGLKAFKTKENLGRFVPKIIEEKPPPKRSVNDLPGSFETRIFVGGNYSAQLAVILEIRRYLGDKYKEILYPIVALDFEMPIDKTREETLRLLHNCAYAIFDMTSAAGQLIEVERARDYGTISLLVNNTMNPNTSESSVTTMLGQYRRDCKGYRDLDQLMKLIDDKIREWFHL